MGVGGARAQEPLVWAGRDLGNPSRADTTTWAAPQKQPNLLKKSELTGYFNFAKKRARLNWVLLAPEAGGQ